MTAGLTPTTIREYDRAAPAPGETETVTFGLGCFWGPDARFGAADGVVRTRVGYAGGTTPEPTYHALGDHTEVLQVDVDPAVRSPRDVFADVFRRHDPTSQAPKTQYHTVVFADGDAQRSALADVLEARGLGEGAGIATRIEPLDGFTLAEEYHQKHALGHTPDLAGVFDEAGYGDDERRESPAAAKLNGLADGNDLPEDDALGDVEARAARFR
jgi:peptide-methionine (S)-S-oxide reductase